MSRNDDEAAELLRIPFALTRRVRPGDSSLRRLRAGESAGRRTWSFDLVINRQQMAGNESVANNYSAAVVALSRRFDGRIALARRGPLRRAEQLDATELAAGTETLRREYRVRATSAELADQVLGEQLCEWLTGAGRGFHYEIVHDRVLAYGWRRYLGGGGPLKAALGLAERIDVSSL